MASLRNKAADMEIGYDILSGEPALYVQIGNQRRYFAKFFGSERADRFLNVLERWDEAGGNDDVIFKDH